MTRAGLAHALVVAVLLLQGCIEPQRIRELYQELAEMRSENRRLQQHIVVQDQRIELLEQGVNQLAWIGDKRIDLLFRAARIEIGRLSGGRDFDGQPGDDGVTVYVRVYDEDEQVLKAAGEIHVTVFDLHAPDAGTVLAELHLGVEAAKANWYGQLLTYHYRIDCRWAAQPPSRREVMVQVTFLDYLTGRALEATRQVEVTPAGSGSEDLDTAADGANLPPDQDR